VARVFLRFPNSRERRPLAEKEEKQQCGYFLLYIGQKGRDIYNTWALKSAEIDKIDALFDRFEAYCNPKQNVTVLRYKFNTRDQRSDENIDQYVTELRRLANDCSYGELLEEMIRDRIVCGTNNPRIKEKLLQAETLDLSRAINIARGIEISIHQLKDLSEESDKTVHAMNKSWSKSNKDKVQDDQGQRSRKERESGRLCSCCGR
jgi:hypothetical protein